MLENDSKTWQVIETIGGASRDRTDDLIVANDALSQLSYSPSVIFYDFNILWFRAWWAKETDLAMRQPQPKA